MYQNPYDILGVKPGDDEQKIKNAYRKLAKEHHPDTGGDVKKFQQVNEAYEHIKSGKPYGQENSRDFSFHFEGNDISDIFKNFKTFPTRHTHTNTHTNAHTSSSSHTHVITS